MTTHLSDIKHFMNLESTRSILGIPSTFPFPQWSPVNFSANAAFTESGDQFETSEHHLSALLQRGIRTLIYVGQTDFGCNWLANLKMVESLEWPGGNEFRNTQTKDWIVDGETKGMVKGSDASQLIFLRVDDAGHMVPHDKPVEALQIVNTWLAGNSF